MIVPRGSGSAALRKVLGFTFSHWRRQKPLALAISLAMTFATLTEVVLPVFAGRLVDAVSQGRDAAPDALRAFVSMVALGLALVVLRHLAWWGVVPLTLRMMRDIASEAFHRVQRFSTDWHANSLRRLDGAQDHARHVGARHVGRRAAAGAAALAVMLVGTVVRARRATGR